MLAKAQDAVCELKQVWTDGSVGDLSAVKVLLQRLEGSQLAQPALRLVKAADLVMPTLRAWSLAVPETLETLQAKKDGLEASLRSSLAAAKLRADQAKTRVVVEAAGLVQPAKDWAAQGKVGEAAQKAQQSAAEAYEQLHQLVDRLQTQAQALVKEHAAPMSQRLRKSVVGEKALMAVTALPLPAGVADWIAQIDGLD